MQGEADRSASLPALASTIPKEGDAGEDFTGEVLTQDFGKRSSEQVEPLVRSTLEEDEGRKAGEALRLLRELFRESRGDRERLELLCQAFATLLGYRWAAIGLLEADRHLKLAVTWGDVGTGTAASVPLAALPGQKLHEGRDWIHWPAAVGEIFPALEELSGRREESYCGYALHDGTGAVIGELFALYHEVDSPEVRHPEVAFFLACLTSLELERQRAQGAAARTGEMLRDLLDHSAEGLILIRPDLRVAAVSRRMAELFDYDEDLLKDASLVDLIRHNIARGEYGEGDPRELLRQRLEVATSEQPHVYKHRRPDGRVVEVRGQPLPHGGFLRSVTEVGDLSQPEQLSGGDRDEPGQRYRLIAEMTADLAFSYVTVGERFELEWLAGPFSKRLLQSAPRFELEQLVHPEDLPLLETCRKRLLQGESTSQELRLKLEEEEAFWVRVIARPLFEPGSGRLLRVVGALQHINEQKQFEAELQQRLERIERADRAKSQFLASVSHELRTPLNAIIGFAEVMEQELLGPIGRAVYRDYARDIRASGRHLLGIINDILDIAKAEAGKLELEQEPFSLIELAADCLHLVRQHAEQAGIYLHSELPRRAPLILADRRRMKQVLLNLLSNAIKFTPSGGEVRLGLKIGPKLGILLKVEDSGIGMSSEEVSRALQRFTQLRVELHRSPEGTGLGLPLSNSLVELHGGRLTLKSESGRGTCANVWLPPSRILYRRSRRSLQSEGNP